MSGKPYALIQRQGPNETNDLLSFGDSICVTSKRCDIEALVSRPRSVYEPVIGTATAAGLSVSQQPLVPIETKQRYIEALSREGVVLEVDGGAYQNRGSSL